MHVIKIGYYEVKVEATDEAGKDETLNFLNRLACAFYAENMEYRHKALEAHYSEIESYERRANEAGSIANELHEYCWQNELYEG